MNKEKSRYASITFEGQFYKGEAEKLIPIFERLGHDAQRAEKSPHPAWQIAEHLKRSMK